MKAFSINDLPPSPKGRTGWPWQVDNYLTSEITNNNEGLPSISIVTPSYNQGQFIEQTIRSVLLQGYQRLEYIIIDGGSADNTVDIIKKYNAYLTYWVSESDNGQCDAINKGTRIATGKIAGWLNSDDILLPGALLAMGKAFRKHPDADLVYGGGGKIDIDGNTIKKIGFRPFDRERIRRVFFILQPSMMYNRESFWKVGGLSVSLNYAMDWELLQKFVPFANVISISDPIAMYRKYEDTKTGAKAGAAAQEMGEIGRKYYGIFDANFLVYRIKTILGRWKTPFAKKIVRPIIDQIILRLTWKYGTLIGRGWPRDDEV